MTYRNPTALDQLADNYVEELAALSPVLATHSGISGHDHELDDFSPDGIAAREAADRAMLARLRDVEPVDDVDRVTLAAMRERLGLAVELVETQEPLRELNVISSPLQAVRDIFDLMPIAEPAHWEIIAQRMRQVPTAIAGYETTLRLGAERDLTPALRQLELGIGQAKNLAAKGSFRESFTERGIAEHQLSESLAQELRQAASAAQTAYSQLADTLSDLAPNAPTADGVGKERYQLLSQEFIGAKIDLAETYEWGQAELARIVAEQLEVAAQVAGPGASVEEAIQALDADPKRKLQGTAALQEWMQETSDEAIEALADVHFDIPEPVRRLECCIAPTQNGAIYYTGPSEGFSRPGQMWWSVPPGVTEFNIWRERTTVYHEGVPGHHLQIGQTTYRSNLLNRWRRLVCWVSGHGEGWALYAERLMSDLGFLDDPGDRLGMLDGQRMRAARVVLDIGVHLGLPHPEGGVWTFERAWEFLKANANMADDFLAFELNRYLGWAGQAPSYKVGQRLWEQARDRAKADEGENFDLKAFHRRALDIGSVGLDVLQQAL